MNDVTMTTNSGTLETRLVWFKPMGRGEKFERKAHALARRLRIPWVRSTLYEKAHPETTNYTGTWGSPWTSMNALANFSFACTCHKRERYSRKGKRKRVRA